MLRLLLAVGPMSRAGIAERLDLTQGTLTRIVAQLSAMGLVRELAPVGPDRVGRPRIPIALDGRAGHAVGMHVGAERVTCGAINLAGQREATIFLPHDGSAASVVSAIAEAYDEISGRAMSPALGLGVITPGWVDADAGVVRHQPLFGWRDLPLKQLIEERLPVPASVDSNARAHANADLLYGFSGGAPDFIHVFVGNVLEVGIVTAGHVRAAGDGFGGDISAWTVAQGDGRAVTAASILSERALVGRAEALGIPLGRRTVTALVEAAREAGPHGERARRLIREHARELGQLLASVSSLLGPELIVVTSAPGALGEDLSDVEAGFDEAAGVAPRPQIRPGANSDSANVLAAASIIMSGALDDARGETWAPILSARPRGRVGGGP